MDGCCRNPRFVSGLLFCPEFRSAVGFWPTRASLRTLSRALAGASVILFHPIFQGLAISLLFGLASSTLLTVLVIPAIYVVLRDDGVLKTTPAAETRRTTP